MKYPSLFGQALLIVGMFTVKSQQVITARGRVRDGVPPAQIWPPAGDRGDRFGNSQTARGQNASDTPGHYTITPNQLNNSALVDSFQNDLFKVVSENTVYASQCPGLGVLFWFANLTSSQAEQLKGKCHNVTFAPREPVSFRNLTKREAGPPPAAGQSDRRLDHILFFDDNFAFGKEPVDVTSSRKRGAHRHPGPEESSKKKKKKKNKKGNKRSAVPAPGYVLQEGAPLDMRVVSQPPGVSLFDMAGYTYPESAEEGITIYLMDTAAASVSGLFATVLAGDPRYDIIRQQGHNLAVKTALQDMAYMYAYARDPDSGVRVVYNNIQYGCDQAMARAKRDGTASNYTMACPGSRLGPVGTHISTASYTEMMSTASVSAWSPTVSLTLATPTLPPSPLKNTTGTTSNRALQGACVPR